MRNFLLPIIAPKRRKNSGAASSALICLLYGGVLIASAGIISSLGLFSSVLLSISRVPKAIADDGIFPSKFTALHPKYNTPYISIIVCALFVSCLSLWTLTDLIVVDVILSGAKLTLELIALIKLRRSHPREHRPFKIPLGIGGLTVLAFFPITHIERGDRIPDFIYSSNEKYAIMGDPFTSYSGFCMEN